MNKIKICILVERLNSGGAERSAGIISKILNNLGYKVYFITLFDEIVYPFNGELINLGQFKQGSRTVINKFLRYKELRGIIENKNFDLVLDFRMKDFAFRELILNKFVFKAKMINMVRSYKVEWYFSKNKWLANYLYKNYIGINTVSYKIQQLIEEKFSFNNVSTIPNPIDLDYINDCLKSPVSFNVNFILAIGRLEPIKQFDKLIESYAITVLPKLNIQLWIIGSGQEKAKLKSIISELQLDDKVKIIDFQNNIFKYINKAKFLVLSSKNEGFPRVLIEALACGIPVVSFNCDSGPSEIIIHEKNGLLVENQDFKSLIFAINRMQNDQNLYVQCCANARKSIEKFSIDNIERQWDEYLNKLNFN